MGTISTYRFAADQLNVTEYKAWIDSLECPLITTNIENNCLYINVDNAYVVYFDVGRYRMGYILRGTASDIGYMYKPNKQKIVVCFSDDVFYIQHTSEQDAGRRMISVYERIDEKRLVANAGSGTDSQYFHAWYSIQDLSFLCLENDLTYSHQPRLKYAQKPDYIDYTIDNLLCGGVISDIADTNFVSCSNITGDTVISFNSQNFYAMGDNILFPID